MGSLVAVDAGRSRCRAAVIGVDGRPGPVAEGRGLPAGTGPATVEGIVETLAATVTSAVVAAAAARHEVGQIDVVSAGLAGLLGNRENAPAVAARLHDRLGAPRVTLCGDVVAAHAGALPDPDGGVVVVAGTGSVAFGAVPVKIPEVDGRTPSPDGRSEGRHRDAARAGSGLESGPPDSGRMAANSPSGRSSRGATGPGEPGAVGSAGPGRGAFGMAGPGAVGAGAHGPGGVGVGGAGPGGGIWAFDSAVACVDGWGYLLGDAGSGFWIGQRGLDAALRAHDGRTGGSPVLARLVERDVGPLDRLPELAARAGAGPVAAIASFSAQVAEAAAAGDEVARHIWREAATHLADSAVACARRLNPTSAAPIALSWLGGLFSAPDPLLLEPFLARIRATFPAADLMPPAGDALSGAARLASPTARGALAGLVYDSSSPRPARVTA
ncbi:MAG TPA: BadF/BadG/BcrA/BcrD ATPase family protein [Acidimicrobiia bacterium]|nr:BadF/BadG/BcrA/BcrD ATPase family protein [Acidimicrobiia bacterium]